MSFLIIIIVTTHLLADQDCATAVKTHVSKVGKVDQKDPRTQRRIDLQGVKDLGISRIL